MYEQGLEDALSHSDEFKARHARFMKLVRPRSVWFEVFVRYVAITTVLSLVFAWGAPMAIDAVHHKGDLIEERIKASDPPSNESSGSTDTPAVPGRIPFTMIMTEYVGRVVGVLPSACALSEESAAFPPATNSGGASSSYVSLFHWAGNGVGIAKASNGPCHWRRKLHEILLVSLSPDIGFIQKATLVMLLFGLAVLRRGQLAREIDMESFPESDNLATRSGDAMGGNDEDARQAGGGFVMPFSQWANHPVIVRRDDANPVTCPLYPVDPLMLDDPSAPRSRTGTYLANVHVTKQLMQHPMLTWPMEMIEDIVSTGCSGRSTADADTRMREVLEDYREAVERRFSWVEFQLWLLPTIGFIGTIFGISVSLVRAKGLFGDGVDSSRALNQVVDGLGVAFDTTSMALFCAALLYFRLRAAEERNEYLLRAAKQSLTGFLLRKLTV